jgi:hypothetical protein
MSSMIGIKVADGDFFPIVAENTDAKKRLILTTAHEGQPSVQIDFYKSSLQSMKDAVYIGTLLLKNISNQKQGSPSIELVVSSNTDGEFSASAYDINLPEDKGKNILAVSLTPLEHSENFDDINLDNSGEYSAAIKNPKPKLLFVAIPIILLALIAFGLYLFLFRPSPDAREAEEESVSALVPPEEIMYEPPPPEPPPVEQFEPPPEPPPVISAIEPPVGVQTPRERAPAPVSSYNAPAVIPSEGIAYKLRWGDTLWDVSQAFYRTPWRYDYLARYNGIRNADRIVSGRTIRVPPLPR